MPTATDEERDLHARLLAGDKTASAEVVESYLTGLIVVLGRKYPEVARRDETMVYDAAVDALLDYTTAPALFNPDRGPLRSYLFMAAKGDLINALAKDQRRHRWEKTADLVELQQPARNRGMSTARVERELEHQEIWTRICELVTDSIEQKVVALMLEGERDTTAYAITMGIVDKDREAQQAEVKRMKDKLKARLRRAGWEGIITDAS